jgi:Asp-tRNA(Asn)/Glu-tRNA(Gln) amidotransferase A subunit family amidase
VVKKRYEAARAEARACDERLARGADDAALPPLFGVPCTVKECIALEVGARARQPLTAVHPRRAFP